MEIKFKYNRGTDVILFDRGELVKGVVSKVVITIDADPRESSGFKKDKVLIMYVIKHGFSMHNSNSAETERPEKLVFEDIDGFDGLFERTYGTACLPAVTRATVAVGDKPDCASDRRHDFEFGGFQNNGGIGPIWTPHRC